MTFHNITGQLTPSIYNSWLRHIRANGIAETWMDDEAKHGQTVRLDQKDVFMDWCRVYKLDEELQHEARANVFERYTSLGIGPYNRLQFAYNGFRQSFQDHAVCAYCHLVISKTDDRLWKMSVQELHLRLSGSCTFAQKIAGRLDILAFDALKIS